MLPLRALLLVLLVAAGSGSCQQAVPASGAPSTGAADQPAPADAAAAANAATPRLPSTTYSDLLRPLDAVRSDMANWSAIEQAAYAVSVKDAGMECAGLQHTVFEGDELLAEARLCALGQNWPATYSAARRYTREATAAHRSDGFSLLLQADLHLDSEHETLDDLKELRGAGPVSAAQEAVFEFAIQLLQISHTSYAVAAALLRQPDLLACANTCASDLPPAQAETEAWHTLTLLKENGSAGTGAAASEIVMAAAARPAALTAVEQMGTAAARRQFESVSKPMPGGVANHRCGKTGSASVNCTTLYVVVPEDAVTTPATMKAVEDLNTRLAPGQQSFLLLSGCTGTFSLRATHTRCVALPLLNMLGAAGAPLLVVTGDSRLVAWTVAGSASWLSAGGAAEVLLGHVANLKR